MEIQNYIDQKKIIYTTLLDYIKDQNSMKENLEEILQNFEKANFFEKRSEFFSFLRLISKISKNHNRVQNFNEKIDNIFLFIHNKLKREFSNKGIFNIFKRNKRILLYLIENQIIEIDEFVLNDLLGQIERQYHFYFYPEIKELLSENDRKEIEDEIPYNYEEDFEKFKENRRRGENENYLCTLIRSDLVSEFIQYVNCNKISLYIIIKPSMFETNSFLMDKETTLIEYAAFFGAIQIFRFLKYNQVNVEPSIWQYAIHSNNPELIHYLEEIEISPKDESYEECLFESIKCHHNDFAYYFLNNKVDQSSTSCNETIISSCFRYFNYLFFQSDFNDNSMFYYLCQYGYVILIGIILTIHKNDYALKDSKNIDDFIYKALNENNTIQIYYLLMITKNISDIFARNNYLKEISIPNAITEIPKFAFNDCESLSKISIASSVTSIGINAFERCINLKNVSIPPSITSIKAYTFMNCTSLTHVSIPSSVTSIENHAFAYCSSLVKIAIPFSVKSIGTKAFFECSKLIKMKIPSSVNKMKKSAFEGCLSLKEIIFPPTIKLIATCLCKNCSSLEQIIIPSSVTAVKDYAFMGCKFLSKIRIFSSEIEIGLNAFDEVVSVEIIGNITALPKRMFSFCYSLKRIIIPSSITSISDNLFRNCKSLEQVTTSSVSSNDELIHLTIPSSVKSIGQGAFSGCKSLEQITIPSSVKSIGQGAFSECTSLEQISIPSSVESIGGYAFYECYNLKKVTIPSSIFSIEECTFYGCRYLRQISIPSSITIIGKNAFSKCLSLKTISIPSSVTFIDHSAFSECISLKQISMPTIINSIQSHTFYECISLTEVTIPSSVTSIEDYSFYKCTSLAEITIPSSVKSIGEFAFYECKNLIHISIPFTISKVGKKAFDKCEKSNILFVNERNSDSFFLYDKESNHLLIISQNAYIKSELQEFTDKIQQISLSQSVISIQDHGFSGCSSLTKIIIPSSVTSICVYAFNECSSLIDISIPSSVKLIGDYAFRGCKSIIEMTIPESVCFLGCGVFEGCSSLKKINLPKNFSQIGDRMFKGCASLENIEIPSSVSFISNDAFEGCSSLKKISLPFSIDINNIVLPQLVEIIKI
ncbi:hypothetical protein M9Y10_008515 [Tritrichomonas musculus]|uniref:Uncharacterized protein n=1 Tax=Tritrichomonas musculus TaxID=1915356 RepID=A0ABR2IYA3_9EUKA